MGRFRVPEESSGEAIGKGTALLSEDLSISAMPVLWNDHQGQQHLWHGAGLSTEQSAHAANDRDT